MRSEGRRNDHKDRRSLPYVARPTSAGEKQPQTTVETFRGNVSLLVCLRTEETLHVELLTSQILEAFKSRLFSYHQQMVRSPRALNVEKPGLRRDHPRRCWLDRRVAPASPPECPSGFSLLG